MDNELREQLYRQYYREGVVFGLTVIWAAA
jgi:hypothetical protein